jgi:hypothetical protein
MDSYLAELDQPSQLNKLSPSEHYFATHAVVALENNIVNNSRKGN